MWEVRDTGRRRRRAAVLGAASQQARPPHTRHRFYGVQDNVLEYEAQLGAHVVEGLGVVGAGPLFSAAAA